ncbi:MAG: TAXI family TRAP transporter solute-binding subunit [Hyphomicrobiales bacterium]
MTGFSIGAKFLYLFFAVFILAGAVFYYIYWQNNKLEVLRVDAGPREGETYLLMSEFAEVIERNSDILRLEVYASRRSEKTNSSDLMADIDLTTVQSHTPAIPDTQLVVGLYEEVFQLITRADSTVFSVKDLNGKRLALPPYGSSELAFFWAIGDHYNLYVQNVDWASMSESKAINLLLHNKVDALFFVGSERNLATLKLIEEFELKKGAPKLRMIEIDQVAAMAVKRPYIEKFELDKGVFDGNPSLPDRGITTGAVRRLLVAKTSAKEKLIRELTRVLFENRADLTVRFPLASQIVAPDLASGLKLPLHPGAERYYTRNEPSFIQENAEPLALLVTVIAMLTSGLLTLKSRGNARKKNQADELNYDVLSIGKEISKTRGQKKLLECQMRMQDLLDKAVVALDVDDVSDAGFQSFAFLWKTVSADLEEKLAKK